MSNWNGVPKTWQHGQIMSADVLNQEVRDRLAYLHTPPFDIKRSNSDWNLTSVPLVPLLPSEDFSITLSGPGGLCQIGMSLTLTPDSAGRIFTMGYLLDGATWVSRLNGGNTDYSFYYRLEDQSSYEQTHNSIDWIVDLEPGEHTFVPYVATNAGTITVKGTLASTKFWVRLY